MAYNLNSQSTPCRIVQCPNRVVKCKDTIGTKNLNSGESQTLEGLGDTQTLEDLGATPANANPTYLSYNDTIRDYKLELAGPIEVIINHLLTMAPIFADVRDGFGKIILHAETALSCQGFLYKDKNDSLPTFDLSTAVTNKQGEAILFPAVYSSSSYGTKDLPRVFGYAMEQCVNLYKANSDNEITAVRLDMVERVLQSA